MTARFAWVIPNASNPVLGGTTSVAYAGGQSGLLSLIRASDGFVYVANGLLAGRFPYLSSSNLRVIAH